MIATTRTSKLVAMANCACFEDVSRVKLNCWAAGIAGFLFFTGWWLMIDVNAAYEGYIAYNKVYHLPGIFATLALLLVNIVPIHAVQDTYYYSDRKCSAFFLNLFLFFGLLMAFGALIGASFILVNDFLMRPKMHQWPGAGIFLQNAFIFSANMILKFGTKADEF